MSKVPILISSLALIVVTFGMWKCWKRRSTKKDDDDPPRSNNVASAIAKFETPEKEEEKTGLLVRRSNNGVSSTIANFETTTTNNTKPNNDPSPSPTTRSAWKSFVFGKRPSSNNKQAAVIATPPDCAVCHKRIFPTQPKTMARQNAFHTSCFKCSDCGTKLFHFPEESHVKIGPTLFLHCRRCQLDSEQKYKPRLVSKLAGTKTLVGDSEQGDITQVKEAIGDDLEDVMMGMTPRCATCGGDFSTYQGQGQQHDDISIVGALKYHKECLLMGKPSASVSVLQQQSSIMLVPVQAAKHLPETIILRISSLTAAAADDDDGNNKKKKVIASLYFSWNDKEQELKSLRREKPQDTSIRVQFHLDQNAGSSKKRNLPTPGGDDDELCVDVIGDEMAAAPTTKMVLVENPSMIASSSSLLRAKVVFTKFHLHHSLLLEIPCCCSSGPPNSQELLLELTSATLAVEIIQDTTHPV
jgi:hypothetical protein